MKMKKYEHASALSKILWTSRGEHFGLFLRQPFTPAASKSGKKSFRKETKKLIAMTIKRGDTPRLFETKLNLTSSAKNIELLAEFDQILIEFFKKKSKLKICNKVLNWRVLK